MTSPAETNLVWRQLLIVVGFLAIPILWGVAVNGLFDLWNGRDEDETDDGIFPDYQI